MEDEGVLEALHRVFFTVACITCRLCDHEQNGDCVDFSDTFYMFF